MKRFMCLVILLAACWPLQGFCAEDQPSPKANSGKSKNEPRAESGRPKKKPRPEKVEAVELRIYDVTDLKDPDIPKKIREEMPRDWGTDRAIEEREGKLIVMQTPTNHAVIDKYLRRLRCERNGAKR